MTEQEWLVSTDITNMLTCKAIDASRLFMFSCACCRSAWTTIGKTGRNAVQVAEKYARDNSLRMQLFDATQECAIEAIRFLASVALYHGAERISGRMRLLDWVDVSTQIVILRDVVGNPYLGTPSHSIQCPECKGKHFVPRRLNGVSMGDMVGCGTCSCAGQITQVGLHPSVLSWNSNTVLQMAQTISEKRSYADMPILADALEDAGCIHEEIVEHCRQSGDHFYGCWVLDTILGLYARKINATK